MMPRVRFVRSGDGTSIALATLGQGPPLVLMPALPFSHLEKMWEFPQLREGLEALARRWTVIRYDNRGCGLSQRNVTDYSLDAHVADLSSVVDELGLDKFALNAPMLAGPVAVAYAARNRERVTHLVLQSTMARSADVLSPPAEALLGLAEKDWTLFTETSARFILQWADEDLARQAAPILRECVTQDAALSLLRAALRFDVTPLLPLVKCPTLVVHNRQFPVELAIARDLASRIPDARLAAADGLESVVAAAIEFLGGVEGPVGIARRAAVSGAPASPTADPLGLSQREIEVLRLVAAGKSNRQIADELVISRNTVDRHVSHILSKIGAANRAEAVAYAAKQRLLS